MSHIATGSVSTEPMYISGRRRTCSRCSSLRKDAASEDILVAMPLADERGLPIYTALSIHTRVRHTLTHSIKAQHTTHTVEWHSNMSDPLTVFDPASATATERAVLMLIERVDDLERRLQEAERKTFAHLLTVTCAQLFVVYVEALCYVLGLPPREFERLKRSMFTLPSRFSSIWGTLTDVVAWAASTRHDPAALKRAEELHGVMFLGAQSAPAPFWSPDFTPLVTTEEDREMARRTNVVSMLRHLSVTEVEGLWEWRLIRAGWCGQNDL